MARVIFENLSLQDAIILGDWYEGQGEQDAEPWFEERGSKPPLTDVGRKGGYMEVVGEDVIVYCKSV